MATGTETVETPAANTVDLSLVPGVVTIENVGSERKVIAISGSSQSFPIAPGQTIKVRVDTTSELVGYLSQDKDGELEVTAPAARIS